MPNNSPGAGNAGYQRNPSGLRTPNFSPNPLRTISVVSAGSASHPVPFRLRQPLIRSTVPINVVDAPGASGTI